MKKTNPLLQISPEAKVRIGVPHSSFMETFLHALPGRNTPIARMEIYNDVLRLCETIFVARLDENSRMAVIEEIKRRAKDERFPHTLVFPEGTCTNRQA